ncbi:hypothetical protein [Clostridium beijerinckii]|uniref:hypothetical protein n=2 Tax=Clostridium beijerinckii TaxID=1520 RepID=UPI00156EE3DA|nr:hypothetical protein [Clostridium beijerinckii]NRU52531.1 hypothetical protein [Clostridium beijerinckii]NYC69410.1 hypothetical protein [Clostridium beijerinckii]NYC91732.1 hypothetical protein [Clostridium beijerinckii]
MKIENNSTFVMIDDKYIKDGDYILTSEQLTILTLASMNLSCKGTCTISITWIMDMLNYSRNNNRKVNDIKLILQQLIDDNVIELYKNVLNDYKENKINNIESIDRNDFLYCYIPDVVDYTIIYDLEILELLKIANTYKLDTYSLINFVLYIYSFINNSETDEDYKLCYPSFNNISDTIGIGESTIVKYTDILQANEILYCDYAGYKETTKGQIKNSKMFYSRYMDIELLTNRVNRYREQNGFIKLNKLSKNKSNIKRSLKQMINTLENKINENTITNLEQERLKLLQEEYNKLEKQDKENKSQSE